MDAQKWWQLAGDWSARKTPAGTEITDARGNRHRLVLQIGDGTKRAPDGRFFVVAAHPPSVGDWTDVPPPV